MSVCDYIWRNIWMLFSVSFVWLFAAMHNFLAATSHSLKIWSDWKVFTPFVSQWKVLTGRKITMFNWMVFCLNITQTSLKVVHWLYISYLRLYVHRKSRREGKIDMQMKHLNYSHLPSKGVMLPSVLRQSNACLKIHLFQKFKPPLPFWS